MRQTATIENRKLRIVRKAPLSHRRRANGAIPGSSQLPHSLSWFVGMKAVFLAHQCEPMQITARTPCGSCGRLQNINKPVLRRLGSHPLNSANDAIRVDYRNRSQSLPHRNSAYTRCPSLVRRMRFSMREATSCTEAYAAPPPRSPSVYEIIILEAASIAVHLQQSLVPCTIHAESQLGGRFDCGFSLPEAIGENDD
jgi:hypothetical protein